MVLRHSSENGSIYYLQKTAILLNFISLFAAEILGLHVKGRLTLSGEELEALDSFQLGEAIDKVKQLFCKRKS